MTNSPITAHGQPQSSLGRSSLIIGHWCLVIVHACQSASAQAPSAAVPRTEVNQSRAAALGIRLLPGKHIRLFTDLAARAEVDCLPEVFDQAFPQWCAYFQIDPAVISGWRVTAFLMHDKALFQRLGVVPEDLPQFHDGYSRYQELWLLDQPSDYYRRHLLLHEGTHSFMSLELGGLGPVWYAEGMAELLATHRWADGKLTLNVMPKTRDDVPYWGRVKIVRSAFAEHRAKSFEQVLAIAPDMPDENDLYGWAWAAAALLDAHPRYRDRFRKLSRLVHQPDFNQSFRQLIGDDWDALVEEWQVFVGTLEYGHDVARTAIDFTPGGPVPDEGRTVSVAADRGWQNSGLRLEAGQAYSLRARGRYQVADRPRPWPCEPGGVSIRYYQGRPLGILLGAVRPDGPPRSPTALLRPLAIGLGRTLSPPQSGTLFLKINDSPGELDDNSGQLEVRVKPQQPPAGG
jgi:hypothetical protein